MDYKKYTKKYKELLSKLTSKVSKATGTKESEVLTMFGLLLLIVGFVFAIKTTLIVVVLLVIYFTYTTIADLKKDKKITSVKDEFPPMEKK